MAERLLISWVFLLFWLTISGYTLAYDTEKEQYWEKEVRNQIKNGKIESLDANNHKFMSIFIPDNSGITQGAIILLHDHGQWLPINHASAGVGHKFGVQRIVTPRGMLSPWAMHHHGRILNPVNTFGYTLLGLKALDERIAALESK